MQLRILIYLIVISVLFSCTDEPVKSVFSVSVRNNTNTVFEILGYDSNNFLIYSDLVDTNSNSEKCEGSMESFIGLGTCNVDSVVVRFPNSKGYVCTLRGDIGLLCFDNRSLFDIGSFQDLGENRFEFSVNQQDFENAFELP